MFIFTVSIFDFLKCIAITFIIGFLIRRDTFISERIPEVIKEYIFVLLGLVPLPYFAITSTIADVFAYIVTWFMAALFLPLIDSYIDEKFSV